MIIYLIQVKPFKKLDQTKNEIFNELFILQTIYSLFFFTDQFDNIELRFKIGWILITSSSFSLTVNFFLMIRQFILKMVNFLKRKIKKVKKLDFIQVESQHLPEKA